MSRPSRRQVQSYQPPAPATYSSVPQSSPPRRSSLQQGPGYHYHYQSQVAGPRPVQHGRAQSTSSHGHYTTTSQTHYAPSQGHYTSSHGHGRSRSNERRSSSRNGVTMGVATGQIGSAYGPYSYHTNPPPRNAGVYRQGRFSNTPSENSLSTGDHTSQQPLHQPQPAPPQAPLPQRTTTVPAFMWDKEPDLDDALHTPDPRRDNSWTPFSWRGWVNVLGILILLSGLLTLFIGFPVIDYAQNRYRAIHGFSVGGVNGSGQIPELPGMPRLIDYDTPQEAYSRVGTDGQRYELVFSDEFNVDGRTFYPGDDPYWEAVDLHYWPTNNLEWYDPGHVTTEDGKLVITFEQRLYRDLNFMSGMLSSWNKLCFTTGYIEVSVSLPGNGQVPGLWPAVWTLGNLGRAGYGATTEGTWPYSYDECDLGTFPGQQSPDGVPSDEILTYSRTGARLSALPGQKLSACSCPGSDHPGPRPDVGRAAPEVDVIEAESKEGIGLVSQSFQIAPYDYEYWPNREEYSTIYNETISHANSYTGGEYQQAISTVSEVTPRNGPYNGTSYTTFGYELWSDPKNRDDGYITWFSGGVPTWTLRAGAIGPNNRTRVGRRIIPEEPMYIIFNVGMAFNFERPNFNALEFPAKMHIDYVRVYQREGVKHGVTCDPPNYPTADYIERHINAYTNPNLTTWEGAGNTFPRNRLLDGC
ncbi:beta-glucan synthesis-associated protein [Coprinopsis cinerea okayama7|uniref:Beta-glucan synthesis-associated protein n=1 Tax=Coprinopsis cinerea (strain Okayama-7 / 130 / ATCC MYA-4618 / FGSC 9003) TaxID=240176 RepID=A8NRU0_COPC7|nr:beta-glucan synthesis-associated protein [Coprinopsis cinerea okayama7\|eukprot:XP_001835854.2 beta-glucan synthesis-associated protein [Coprinopsis cinerea okayama7\